MPKGKGGGDDRTKPVAEQILVEAARIYDAREGEDAESKDLKTYAEFLSKQDAFTKHLPPQLLERALNMRPPRDRITCLLIGNHSAGKSSFVNWYVGENIQNESVAIETAGVTIVRRGRQRATWKGPQTVSAFPHLQTLGDMEGVKDFITTEFCLSLERNFPLVEFIDTPGLTDGTLKYPFDVDQVIYELAEHATMIMVFLDPIGKALVSRCMNVVEKLALNHSAKMSYYLTKFDTAGNEVDRTNVVSQIVQELQGRVRATHALKLHTMYLPERADENTRKTVPNKITDLCQNISKEIDSRVQDVLDQLSKDSKALSQIVDAKVDRNKNCVSHNTWATVWRYTLSALFAAFFSLAAYWGILNFIGRAHDPLGFCLASQVTADAAQDKLYCVLLTAAKGIPAGVALALLFVWMVVMYFQKTKNGEQLSAQEMKRLMDIQADINGNIAKKHKDLKKRLTEDALDDHLA
jgi:GTPase SAR1 family protein